MVRIKNPIRFTIIMILFFSIVVGFSLKFVPIVRTFFKHGESEIKKITAIDYEKKDHLMICPFQETILIYDANGLTAYGLDGKVKWHLNEKLDDPVMVSGEKILLLGDKHIGKIKAFNTHGTMLWSFNLKKPFKDLLCNQKGFAVLYSEQDREKVYTLNPNGEQEGEITIPNGYILDIGIAEDKYKIAIAVMDIDKNKIQTNVAFYSMAGKLLGGNKYDEMISKLFLNSDGNIINLGDEKLICFNNEKGLLWDKRISDSISRAAWNQNGFIVLGLATHGTAIMDGKAESALCIINSKGVELNRIPIQDEILGLDTKGNHIVAFTNRTLYFFSKEGKQLAEKKIYKDIQAIRMLSSDKIVVVLKNKVEVMQIKDKNNQ